jgi:hypothetical protein
MTTITEPTPILSDEDERADAIEKLTDRMAADMLRSGIPLDAEIGLSLALCDRGWDALQVVNLFPYALVAARRAMAVAETYSLQISDREFLH